jgi:hypothetical protein
VADDEEGDGEGGKSDGDGDKEGDGDRQRQHGLHNQEVLAFEEWLCTLWQQDGEYESPHYTNHHLQKT